MNYNIDLLSVNLCVIMLNIFVLKLDGIPQEKIIANIS